MARLRVLAVSTPEGLRDILILDKITIDEMDPNSLNNEGLKEIGLPPVLAFSFEVDIPELDTVELAATTPPQPECTTVLLAANNDEVREWAADQPHGLDGVLIINVNEGIPEGLTIPPGTTIMFLPGYAQLPETTRLPVEAALAAAKAKTP